MQITFLYVTLAYTPSLLKFHEIDQIILVSPPLGKFSYLISEMMRGFISCLIWKFGKATMSWDQDYTFLYVTLAYTPSLLKFHEIDQIILVAPPLGKFSYLISEMMRGFISCLIWKFGKATMSWDQDMKVWPKFHMKGMRAGLVHMWLNVNHTIE